MARATPQAAKSAKAVKATRAPAPPAAGAIAKFFATLAERGYEPLLQGAEGSVRFDLSDGGAGEHWFVDVRKGAVAVSRKATKADAVFRLDKALCERLVTGRANAMAAMLRGLISAEGDLALAIQFQRLFPGPPRSGKKAS